MNIRHLAAVAALAVASLSSGLAQAQEFQINPDGNFGEGNVRLSAGMAPPYSFLWDLRPVDGSIAVCGVGHLRDSRFSSNIRQMLSGGIVTINGRDIPVNLNFFSRARTASSLASTPATCRVVAPFSGGQVSFRLGRTTFRN